MSKNIVEELPARKHTPVAAPVAAKKEDGKADPKGGNTQEASAKRISQAVYDIRYRAKTDKITLEAAYNSYMGNSNLTKEEKDIVKERLFGKKGGGVKEHQLAFAHESNVAFDDDGKPITSRTIDPELAERLAKRTTRVKWADDNGKEIASYCEPVEGWLDDGGHHGEGDIELLERIVGGNAKFTA